MATQYAPGVLQVVMRYAYDGQQIQNVFHVDRWNDDNWSEPEINDVLDVFEDDFFPLLAPLLPSTLVLMELIGNDLGSITSIKVSRLVTGGGAGTSASPGLPANATLAVKLASLERGRGRSGRFFFPALVESVVVQNTVDAAYRTSIIDAVETLRTNLAAMDPSVELAILSREINKVERPTGVAIPISAVAITDQYVDSQKNRLPNHKRRRKPKAATPTP